MLEPTRKEKTRMTETDKVQNKAEMQTAYKATTEMETSSFHLKHQLAKKGLIRNLKKLSCFINNMYPSLYQVKAEQLCKLGCAKITTNQQLLRKLLTRDLLGISNN